MNKRSFLRSIAGAVMAVAMAKSLGATEPEVVEIPAGEWYWTYTYHIYGNTVLTGSSYYMRVEGPGGQIQNWSYNANPS